ncbi:hypothetical protein JMM61_13285 [Rhodovulum sulfidophilum]|uniref:hypothetical protein n=1 Tax=Rhodovulum sulfidophilum TaxID=35806 RepID=UPI0019239CA1|nr:hypothetical protein [Rhodovulum sulfidophilum]MBL3565794.1 hypothetical protein [Rhodovulum sulfidophilum]MBL3586351.1 hypothetical protein [Rhodovulum sulfidophilum]
MQALIDAVPHQWRYKSGVISFAGEDAPTEEQQRAVIQRLEDFACAGLEADQFDMLWVRHTHARGPFVTLTVECLGCRFKLGPIQAEVVRALHEAAQADAPWQNGKAILSRAGSKSLRMTESMLL